MNWYELEEPDAIASPALLVYADRLESNIHAAIDAAGNPGRLRPHVKTHKSADVVRLHLDRGVSRFKCATTAEARMLAEAGAPDILLAYQPVGPAIDRLLRLARDHRGARFACIVDSPGTVDVLDLLAERYGVELGVMVDLDVGMRRTGISPGPQADALYERIVTARWLRAAGIHAYDGHSTARDLAERASQAQTARELALGMRARQIEAGRPVPELVLGGTPPFLLHASAVHDLPEEVRAAVSLSPGTYAYFDWGYAENYPDLPFIAAALVLGRVISVPEPGRFTVDVGSKAIAADPPGARGTMISLPGAEPGKQSEEHWEWSVEPELTPALGSVVYIWPRHICPTVEHYDRTALVEERRVAEWRAVTARGRLG